MKVGTLLLVGCLLPAAVAEETLKELSLEQLLEVEVTSNRKKVERLDQVAAAVHVITQEDIRRSGATSIPEVLRQAPGIHVARINAHSWAISVRGFSSAFSNKLLVMVDGRSVYTPLFSGVWWDTLSPPLESVERIEVIRGPAGAIWGANAVNGVIHIITFRADQTQDSLVSATSGTEDWGIGHYRYGGTFGKTGSYRLHGQFSVRNQWSPDPALEDDYWGLGQGGFRTDWHHGARHEFSLQGSAFNGYGTQFESPAVALGRPSSFTQHPLDTHGANVLGSWGVAHRSGAYTNVQSYFDRTARPASGIGTRVDTVDAEIRHHRPAGRRHTLLLSGGYRAMRDETEASGFDQIVPAKRQYGVGHISAVDDISLAKEFTLSLGARVEHNTFTGWNMQPTARILWNADPKHTMWAAISRALRTPSRGELGVVSFWPEIGVGFLGNKDLRPESLHAVEAGYRGQWTKWLTLDVAVFRNRYDDLRSGTAVPAPDGYPPQTYWRLTVNGLAASSSGGEILTEVRLRPVKLTASYSGLFPEVWRIQDGAVQPRGVGEQNSPVHQWKGQMAVPLGRGITWNTALSHIGPAYSSLAGERLTYTKLDTNLVIRTGESSDLTIGGYNLLSPSHREYFAGEGPAVVEIPRALIVRWTTRF